MNLLPGSNCSLAISFTPQVAGSPLIEQVTITDNEANNPANQRTIALTGSAIGKAEQTISFPPIPDTVFGSPMLPLTAVSSSGLAVTYRVLSGPAVLVAGRSDISLTGAGMVTVQANQAGNSAYDAAGAVTVSFNVLPATLTVTPVDATAVYGSVPSSFNYTVTGFVTGQPAYLAFSGRPMVATNAAPYAGVGTYTLTASPGTLSSANYTFIFATGKLVITPAWLQVKSVSVSNVYGSVMPSLTWTLSGLKNGDSASAVTGVPMLTTNANSGSPVGTYPISISSGTLLAQNYSFQFVAGTVTVLPAVLTITASNQTLLYGDAIPVLTWSITGLVQGDTRNVISGSPVLGTQAITGSNTGTYPISMAAGTLSAVNYTFRFQPGQLLIQKVSLTVTAPSLTVVYGQPLPAYSCTISGFVNGDTQASSISGSPSVTSTAIRTSRPGTYVIAVSPGSLAARNYSFNAVSGSLTIAKATLTITPHPISMPYGSAIPAIAYDISGYVFGDGPTSVRGQATFSANAGAASPIGTYTLTGDAASMSSDSYVFHVLPGTLQIQKAVLVITPASAAITYGSALPAFTYSLAGFVNGEDAGVVSGQPSLGTTATSSSPSGTYPISVSAGTLTAANYSFLPGAGKLTINKAQLTVNPEPASMPYGGVTAHLTFTLTGFVNGETSTAVAGSPVLWTTAPLKAPVGTYSINGSQGNLSAANYTFVVGSGSFTVSKAVLTVNVASASTTYGQTAPMFSYTVTGFAFGETVEVIRGGASLSSSYTQSSPAGMYPILADTGALAADNYMFRTVSGNLTVNKSPLVVTPLDSTMVYGCPLPTLAYTITGFVNGDSSAVVSGIASVTSTARSTSYVGTYPIVVDTSALSAINYTFTKGQGSLVITKASLAVIPDAIAMTYGGAVPRLTYKISGLVNGDAATVVSGSPSLTANIPDGGAVGSYPISGTPGTLTAGNYFFVVGTGVLTINRAVLTVTAAPASMTYGGMVSPLSYKISGFVHGEDATVISGSPVLSTTCSSLSPVGACAILVSTGNLTAASYSFQTANGLLLVYKASLQVSATNASMTYGGTIPTLQYQITGFLNGDTGSVVSGQPVLAAKVPSPSVAGVYPIVIDVSGMTASNYVIAGVPGKFTVARATLTVTPANAVTSYGGPWPVFSYQITGFVNGDSVAVVSGGAALSSNANNRSVVGKYSWNAVTNSLWAANYTFLCGTGTLTIIPAVLTVVASPMTMTYGSATPSLGYGFSGFVNGDGPAAISGSPAESTVAAPLSPTGSYPITISAGTLSAANYTFVFVNGTMTVSRAVLKVVPANVSMMYGAAVPSLTYALQGFVNGDTQASATTGTAQLTTTATSSSAVGQYDITSSISTLQTANYTFLLQTGKLSVAAAPLTVTANNQSMKVGATVPQLTFAITGFVNGDTTASATTGSPTLTTSATSTSSAGAYSISIAKGTMNAVNYQFTFRSGTLTVSK